MSTTSPREQASSDMARVQAQLGDELANSSYPLISRALKEAFGNFQGGEGNINSIYDKAKTQMNEGYANQSWVTGELAGQQARQSGLPITSGQVDARVGMNRQVLGQQQFQDTQNLEYQRMGSQLSNYQSLLGALGQGSNQAIGISQGFAGNQQNAAGMLSGQSQFGGALGGAASGASIGGVTGLGAIPGALIGGAIGYFGSGG